jgi:cbb3-type cytochrome oxidase cytochrome c subunit
MSDNKIDDAVKKEKIATSLNLVLMVASLRDRHGLDKKDLIKEIDALIAILISAKRLLEKDNRGE